MIKVELPLEKDFMSWIFGIIGKQKKINHNKVQLIHQKPIFKHKSSGLYIAAGGIKETLFTHIDKENATSGWCVAGVGINNRNDDFSMMSQKDWESFFVDFNPEKFSRLNGHFAIIRWQNEIVECYTDQIGLRNFYITNIDNNFTIFSTRLDWVAKCNNESKIDLQQFASQWLLINSISDDSSVTKIARLKQNGKAICSSKTYTAHNFPWTPSFNLTKDNIVIEDILKKLTLFPLKDKNTLSLGFSGGLDSRVLLALLMQSKDKNWKLHSFGDPDLPDNIISQRIASKLNIQNDFYKVDFNQELLNEEYFNNFVGSTQGNSPIYASVLLSIYPSLNKNNDVIIDGAFGEIARRRLLNHLLFFGKKALIDGDSNRVTSLLQMNRASIFNKDVLDLMNNAAIKQVDSLMKSLPEIKEIGVENWLDIFSIRARLPNTAGYEQVRIDSMAVNYMPFVQPVFLEALFNIPLKKRNKGAFFKQIIKSQKELTRFPLIKESIYYNYNTPHLLSAAKLRLNQKFGLGYKDTFAIQFLNEIPEFVQDTLHSLAVRSYDAYNYDYISKIVLNFYKGETRYSSEVNWWLTYNLWRNNVDDFQNIFV